MGNTTGIEWTDATWNPIRGCSRVSEGCRNCYAERVAHRFSGAGQPYEGLTQPHIISADYNEKTGVTKRKYRGQWTGQVKLVEEHLLDPLKWKAVKLPCADPSCGEMERATGCYGPETRLRRIFVNSMSDLFHPNVPDEWIDRIFAVMALCPQHTFQILTKRPERMLAYLTDRSVRQRIHMLACAMYPTGVGRRIQWISPLSLGGWPLPNVQLGVSVEDQKTADERIPLLLQTPAAVRFISAEPLLGAIDLDSLGIFEGEAKEEDGELVYDGFRYNALTGEAWADDAGDLTGDCGMTGKLDWVIIGGESGPGARPMHPDWARSLRDQCHAASVPFFFKQWGEFLPSDVPFVEADSRFNEAGHRVPPMQFMPNNPRAELLRSGKTKDIDIRNALLGSDGVSMYRVGKKAAGSLLDGREWKEFPRCQ